MVWLYIINSEVPAPGDSLSWDTKPIVLWYHYTKTLPCKWRAVAVLLGSLVYCKKACRWPTLSRGRTEGFCSFEEQKCHDKTPYRKTNTALLAESSQVKNGWKLCDRHHVTFQQKIKCACWSHCCYFQIYIRKSLVPCRPRHVLDCCKATLWFVTLLSAHAGWWRETD